MLEFATGVVIGALAGIIAGFVITIIAVSARRNSD
jgi:hypothetical protein